MPVYNMLQAKTHLSKIVESVESGAESEVIIARNGRPVARLVAIGKKPVFPKRLGLLDGKYPPLLPEDFSAFDDEIAEMFNGVPA